MARQRVGKAKAQEIQARLESFVVSTFGTWYRFRQRTGFRRPTVDAWSRKRDPSVPDVPSLLQFTEKFGLNPSWLLLGIGPKRIEPTELPEPIEERLRVALVGELITMEGLSRIRVEGCLPPAELVYHVALAEMRRLLWVMNTWDRDADRDKNLLRRQVKAAENMGEKAQGARLKRDLEGLKERLKRERRTFMARQIAGRLPHPDEMPRLPLDPTRPGFPRRRRTDGHGPG